jgi:hypothetical protein
MKSLAGTHLIKIKNRISAQKKGGEPKPTAERLPYGESFLSGGTSGRRSRQN